MTKKHPRDEETVPASTGHQVRPTRGGLRPGNKLVSELKVPSRQDREPEDEETNRRLDDARRALRAAHAVVSTIAVAADAIPEVQSSLSRMGIDTVAEDRPAGRPIGEAEGRTLFDLAQVHLRRQEWSEAARCLERAGQIFHGLNSPRDEARTFRSLGEAYRNQGRLDDAESYLRRALELSPTEARTFRSLAHLYFEQGRLDDAESHLRRALELYSELQSASELHSQPESVSEPD